MSCLVPRPHFSVGPCASWVLWSEWEEAVSSGTSPKCIDLEGLVPVRKMPYRGLGKCMPIIGNFSFNATVINMYHGNKSTSSSTFVL